MYVWLTVLMQQFGSHWTEFHEIGNLIIFGKSAEKIQVSLKSDKCNGYFTRRYTFMIVSRSFLLRMRNFSYKLCRENQNTYFMFIFSPEHRCVYEIMWKNTVEPNWPQMTVLCMSVACWIPKATNTTSEYVLFLFYYNSGFTNAPLCYVIRTLPVLLNFIWFRFVLYAFSKEQLDFLSFL